MNHIKTGAAVLALALSTTAAADKIELKNGSVLIGTLISAESGSIVFETPFAGQITIKTENVARASTDETVTLKMADGTIYREKKIVSTEEGTAVSGEDGATRYFEGKDIAYVNPHPYLLGEGYKWSGEINLGLDAERGNSDTDEWDFYTTTNWRSLEDRYSIRAWGEFDETSGEKVSEDFSLYTKYDRFFEENPDNYYGVKLRFEYDKFADLDLRTIVGPHLGRQFFDSDLLKLTAELGPVWVDEQFDVAEDDDWPGALWNIEASSDIVGYGTTIYVIHDGTLNLDNTADTLLNARVGLKLPLIFGLQTKFEVLYEYDGGAVEGVDDTDETYNFSIGYDW
jgi:putative salt-induced outer membrane protein YdiY